MIKNLVLLLTFLSLIVYSCDYDGERNTEFNVTDSVFELKEYKYIDSVYEQESLSWSFHFDIKNADTNLIYTLKYYSNGNIEDSISPLVLVLANSRSLALV